LRHIRLVAAKAIQTFGEDDVEVMVLVVSQK
jgi:hypothetical protein